MSMVNVFPRPLEIDAASPESTSSRPPGVVRLLLQRSRALNEELEHPATLFGQLAQLLAISVLAFAMHGAVVGALTLLFSGSSHVGLGPLAWAGLGLAFPLSLIGALGLCLPVFVFCARVAGIEASPIVVALQALRANAVSALALFGMLPAYLAAGLGVLVWHRTLSSEDVYGFTLFLVALGFAMPILVGLFGIRSVYRGFVDLAERQHVSEERRGLVKSIVLGASAAYAVVAPVALIWASWVALRALGASMFS
jgi:hypothetical protein